MRWPFPPPAAVLFDLDGVIVDSAAAHAAAWQALFAEQGIEFGPRDYVEQAEGRPRDAVIRAVLGDRPDHDGLMARKVELMDLSLVRVIPSSMAFVRALGIPYAIATSSNTPRLLLGDLRESFPQVVCRADVKHGKPAPDLFAEAALRLRVPPEECVVVEDSTVGVQAGRAAGCRVIGLGVQADVTVDSLPLAWAQAWWPAKP